MENEIITTGIEEVTEITSDIVAANETSNGYGNTIVGVGIGLAISAAVYAAHKLWKKHKAKKAKADEDAIHQDLEPIDEVE